MALHILKGCGTVLWGGHGMFSPLPQIKRCGCAQRGEDAQKLMQNGSVGADTYRNACEKEPEGQICIETLLDYA